MHIHNKTTANNTTTNTDLPCHQDEPAMPASQLHIHNKTTANNTTTNTDLPCHQDEPAMPASQLHQRSRQLYFD